MDSGSQTAVFISIGHDETQSLLLFKALYNILHLCVHSYLQRVLNILHSSPLLFSALLLLFLLPSSTGMCFLQSQNFLLCLKDHLSYNIFCSVLLSRLENYFFSSLKSLKHRVSFSEAIAVYLDKQVGLPSSIICHEQTES